MAAAATDSNGGGEGEAVIIMSGALTKQGGNVRNWKERHFVLKGTELSYYKKEGDTKPKGVIDLKTGRGIRTMKYISEGIEWPEDVQANYAFAIATSTRTYYIYGKSSKEIQKWKKTIKDIIDEHGSPTNDWKTDVEGKPEHIASKVVKKVAKIGAQVTKKVASEYIQDDNIASIVEGVADGVENQADADRNATIGDRLKRGAGDAVGVAGSGIQLASEYVPDEIGQTAVYTAGGIIKDQGTADTDASIAERLAIGVGSTADCIGECHEEASIVTDLVSKGAEKVTEVLEEDRAEKEEEEKQKKLEQDSDAESDDDENVDTSGI